jgi:hypothetical protein
MEPKKEIVQPYFNSTVYINASPADLTGHIEQIAATRTEQPLFVVVMESDNMTANAAEYVLFLTQKGIDPQTAYVAGLCVDKPKRLPRAIMESIRAEGLPAPYQQKDLINTDTGEIYHDPNPVFLRFLNHVKSEAGQYASQLKKILRENETVGFNQISAQPNLYNYALLYFLNQQAAANPNLKDRIWVYPGIVREDLQESNSGHTASAYFSELFKALRKPAGYPMAQSYFRQGVVKLARVIEDRSVGMSENVARIRKLRTDGYTEVLTVATNENELALMREMERRGANTNFQRTLGVPHSYILDICEKIMIEGALYGIHEDSEISSRLSEDEWKTGLLGWAAYIMFCDANLQKPLESAEDARILGETWTPEITAKIIEKSKTMSLGDAIKAVHGFTDIRFHD